MKIKALQYAEKKLRDQRRQLRENFKQEIIVNLQHGDWTTQEKEQLCRKYGYSMQNLWKVIRKNGLSNVNSHSV